MLPRLMLSSAERNTAQTCRRLSFSFARPSPPLSNFRIPLEPSSRRLLLSCNAQITRSGRHGDPLAAQSTFDRMPFRDVVSWTALLTAYADNGQISAARRVFDEMPSRNTASWNAMMTAYARSSRLAEASELFARMPGRNAVSYGAMISGFAKNGMMKEAEEVYQAMPRRWRDPVATHALICGYLREGKLDLATQVFEAMEVRDVFSWSSMVDGYCKCGRVCDARELFDAMPEKNVVSWTAMIQGCVRSGMWEDGFRLFLQMRRECVSFNSMTLSVMVDACSALDRIREGIQCHALILALGLQNDVFLGNSIIVMYARARWMDDARRSFNCMSIKDLVSWNSLIAGYIQDDALEAANELFEAMPEKDIISWTSMVVGFSKRGWISESVRLFQEMPEKDEIAWTAIISAFVANGKHENAILWFNCMVDEGFRPSAQALSSVLSASANLVILDVGMHIHACTIKTNLESDVAVQSSLVSMYAKCGSVTDAYHIFLSIGEPNLVTVNAMVTAFSQHGLVKEALELLEDMQRYGCKPNHVTFLGILSACAHAGLVDEGYKHFKSMTTLYCVEPGLDHYTCMVDLLGRSGLLREAVDLINSLPLSPHSAIWGALLNASSIHSHLEFAELAAQRLLELEPNNSAAYSVLSNMYGLAVNKKSEERMRMTQMSNGVRKTPGYSWVIFDNALRQLNM
ncbi:pentatricopeptide repeat-containing protein At1g53600, mitochondrial-like [Zingiber officinale]|uniref:Chlororespiratory reduction 4 n=1 Tax=Zingiber officinale TaxID=94328 RepID=A0A8J5HG03_ZINOF|nr:pentatricopeptide repeat-containing protein At1g53600, mitochondrial-like [Zingiber officinale]XP_042461629.1 pentatricopeptide repeat-containing protein At1g53600, mitochondrial-like [Zingiber officinale]XP_042461630.1 pentatricopeptide repeat-containing protein At1g53600, mitochondrial-like [Zingiber officinale]XP_042461631.1 pentatricopeptide repeat-containing protein At1g53600, mitochondrial-like [Zingiber officinale]XP_042461632.1 pentatricopeptide repeat-containing protein At1g53600, m